MGDVAVAINQVAQIAVAVAAIVGAIVALAQNTRWRDSHAVKQAQSVTAIMQQAAEIAVRATEQTAAGVSSTDKRVLALKRATSLCQGLAYDTEVLEQMIEAAVQRMQAERLPVVDASELVGLPSAGQAGKDNGDGIKAAEVSGQVANATAGNDAGESGGAGAAVGGVAASEAGGSAAPVV